jgi:hypothetical protein
MKKSTKSNKSKFQDISENTVDRAIKVLGISPTKKYQASNGVLITVKKETWNRLNSIKRIFSNPENYAQSVPPAEMRALLKKQHRAITETLKVMHLLSGETKQANAIRQELYAVSEISSSLSGGLVGYDIYLDKSFATVKGSLEKIEGYFSTVLAKAEASVKGRGKGKPENTYADNLLGCLCWLYRDITGEIPKASIDDVKGVVRGKVVKFLEVTLRAFPYPHKITPWALERRIRKLKSHDRYGSL